MLADRLVRAIRFGASRGIARMRIPHLRHAAGMIDECEIFEILHHRGFRHG